MSYLALARKWRPRTFSQLIGQEHVNKPLINALNHQRLHHAYLFTGASGVGKTSVARILAKSLNCEQGIRAEPCLQCHACTSIEKGQFIDLIEIDAASKTRVEDTRDLLDNVHYAPTHGRFKIYLIDEVHMLSQHSFNALLKTLEEPPRHVKFILATTDPQKLPVTVLSRCLQFNLKRLVAHLISQHMQLILQDEQLDFEIQAVDILAQAAQGSMRDALSILDQAITCCDDQLRASDVKMILGYTQHDYALQLLQALAEQNAVMVITLSQRISNEGGQFHYVLDELLHYLHQIAVSQCLGDSNSLISLSTDMMNLAGSISSEDIQLFYQIGLKGREEMQLAPTLVLGFSMTLLRMLTFRPAPKVVLPPLSVPKNTLLPQIQSPSLESENSKKTEQSEDWASIIPLLKLTGLALNAARNAELIIKEGPEITLRVVKGHRALFTPAVITRIEQALTHYFQNPVKITLDSQESTQSSPAQQKEQAMQEKQQKAALALHNDPVFQQVQQEFSAELIKNSIVLLKDDL